MLILSRADGGDPMLFSGNVGFYSISFLKFIKISYEDAFKLAEELLSIN